MRRAWLAGAVSAWAIACGLGGAARAAPCTIIYGAKVWLPGGVPGDVDVTLAGGRVSAVGPSGDASCVRVDGTGKVLTAGLVDAMTGLGLVEVELEPSTVDTDLSNGNQDEGHAVRAAVRAALAFNARSLAIPVARSGGVTSALVWPQGGIIAGGALWADLAPVPDAGGRRGVLRDPVAMIASLGATESRAASLHVIDVALREAALFAKDQAAWLRGQRADFVNKALDLEALGPVVRGEVPLVVAADRAADLEALLGLLAGTKVRLVVSGAAEGWLVKTALAERKVPVIVDALMFGPNDFDSLHARADNAALMDAAGVPVCLSVFNTHQVRKLRQVAGNAVREGMRWESALLAVTERPADAFGMADHGRIAVGAVGNVVLWSGDPFELATRVDKVWVDGVEVALRSRQDALFERWRAGLQVR